MTGLSLGVSAYFSQTYNRIAPLFTQCSTPLTGLGGAKAGCAEDETHGHEDDYIHTFHEVSVLNRNFVDLESGEHCTLNRPFQGYGDEFYPKRRKGEPGYERKAGVSVPANRGRPLRRKGWLDPRSDILALSNWEIVRPINTGRPYLWQVRRDLLILFTESLDVRFAVRIEEFLAALLPRGFEFGRCDVPVRPAFLRNGAQVLAKIFQSGPAEEPVAVVDLINDKTGLEDNHVGDHGIVDRISVFGDVEIFLDDTPRVGEERPVGADSAAIFIRLSDIVGADRDKPAIGNLELAMEFNKPFSLPAVLGAETSAAEDKNHGMLSLQFGELPAFRGVVGKLIIGEDSPRNNVRSHVEILPDWMRVAGLRLDG